MAGVPLPVSVALEKINKLLAASLPATPSKYRSEIDGLRALAVIAVIINHANHDFLPSGYLGVDVFFVISGYVITASLLARGLHGFRSFFSGFYERRAVRLLPALVVVVLVTSLLICLFNPEPRAALDAGIASLFGVTNLYLFGQATDYFAQSSLLNPFTHAWSLGVEEQFYLLFPLLIWFCGYRAKWDPATGARVLFYVLMFLTLISYAGFVHLYVLNQPAAYFLMPFRFWEIAAGALVFIGIRHWPRPLGFLARMPPLFGLALIVVVMLRPLGGRAGTTAMVLLTCLLLICLRRDTAGFTLLSWKPMRLIGIISYSLYLWHWPVLCLSRWTIGLHWWSLPAQIFLMLTAALASYCWLERPVRQSYADGKMKSIYFYVLPAIFLAAVLIKLLASQRANFLFLGRSNVEPYGSTQSTALSRASCVGGAKGAADLSFERCTLSERTERVGSLYLVGDSHALALFPLLEQIHHDSVLRTSGLAVPLTPFPSGPGLSNDYKDYADANIQSQLAVEAELLSRIKAEDLVIVANKNYQFSKEQESIYADRLNAFASDLQRRGARMLLLLPIPEYRYVANGVQCGRYWFQLACPDQSRRELEAARQGFVRVLTKTAASYPETVRLFDPFAFICPAAEERCKLVSDRLGPIFYDYAHLNVRVARAMAAPLASQLRPW